MAKRVLFWVMYFPMGLMIIIGSVAQAIFTANEWYSNFLHTFEN